MLVTVSDRKIAVDDGTYAFGSNPGPQGQPDVPFVVKTNNTPDGVMDYYVADVVTAHDYYPFGMVMPGRKYSATNAKYRYGFNGKESDNDVKGVDGGQQDYGMRIYDPRLGRFLSEDPITKKYPELTPYQFASNRPIDGIDLDGLEYVKYSKRATSLIIFPSIRDVVIEAEYQAALRSKMDVMIISGVADASAHLKTKEKKYKRILFDGHGPAEGSAVIIGNYKYTADELRINKSSLKQIGSSLTTDGKIIFLSCLTTTPNCEYATPEGVKKEISKEAAVNTIVALTGKPLFGSDGLVNGTSNQFNSVELSCAANDKKASYYNLAKKYEYSWRLIKPDGTKETFPLGGVSINTNGEVTIKNQLQLLYDNWEKMIKNSQFKDVFRQKSSYKPLPDTTL